MTGLLSPAWGASMFLGAAGSLGGSGGGLSSPAWGASMLSRAGAHPARALGEGAAHADAPAARWSRLIDDLSAVRTLSDDWDGQGADAPHPALVDTAIKLAESFRAGNSTPADRVVAGVNGTVFFEWHGGAVYTEIEVTAPGEAEVRRVRKDTGLTEVLTPARV